MQSYKIATYQEIITVRIQSLAKLDSVSKLSLPLHSSLQSLTAVQLESPSKAEELQKHTGKHTDRNSRIMKQLLLELLELKVRGIGHDTRNGRIDSGLSSNLEAESKLLHAVRIPGAHVLVQKLSLIEDLHGWVSLDFGFHASGLTVVAIHGAHFDLRLSKLLVVAQLLPRGRQPLTPRTPVDVEVDEPHAAGVQSLGERGVGEGHHFCCRRRHGEREQEREGHAKPRHLGLRFHGTGKLARGRVCVSTI